MSRLLIVDDEPDIITLISRYAHREGFEVGAADYVTKPFPLWSLWHASKRS